jgi:starch synthase (maltosyl-transferring)
VVRDVSAIDRWLDVKGNPVHGTFATTKDLSRIAKMGFDVVYLPPIHPIGKVHRKGRNNSVTAAPNDVGSPWAIGSDEGGHDAIHPGLGTIEDFDDFVAAARDDGMEVALDLALQSRPTIPGPGTTPNGSPCCPTARSPTPRTHRRNTRTSTR